MFGVKISGPVSPTRNDLPSCTGPPSCLPLYVWLLIVATFAKPAATAIAAPMKPNGGGYVASAKVAAW